MSQPRDERQDDLFQPPLPTRLVAGLFILKHMHNLSDEALCDRWVENPYFQYFCGEVVFRHELPFDRSSLTRWRQRLGEEQIAALLQESLSVAHRSGAIATEDRAIGQMHDEIGIQQGIILYLVAFALS